MVVCVHFGDGVQLLLPVTLAVVIGSDGKWDHSF